MFEAALQRTTHRLTDLEKALTSRKYFQVDLDKTCNWLRQADAITFPEITLYNVDDSSELQAQLSNFQKVLEQASEYENLLLIVQRIGQEILPTLNEIDHCYLDERLNALPQQYNNILALAKEKKDRVQQIIQERKEFSTFFGITHNALEELQEQFDNLEKQTIRTDEKDVLYLINEHRNIKESLLHISPAVRELNGKNEMLVSRGQHYRAEETVKLLSLHNSLKRRNSQRLRDLEDSLKTVVKHSGVLTSLGLELESVKEELLTLKLNTEVGAMDKITSLYLLLERLDCANLQTEECKQHTKGLHLNFDPSALQNALSQQELLQSVRNEVLCLIEESEKDSTDHEEVWQCLEMIKAKMNEPVVLLEVTVNHVHVQQWRLKAIEGKMKSSLRIAANAFNLEDKLAKMEEEIQQAMCKKQVFLTLSYVIVCI